MVLVMVCSIASTSRAQSTARDTSRSAGRSDSSRAQAMGAILVRPQTGRFADTASITARTLSSQELSRTPQPMGDLFRALARVPGIGSTDQSARLALRGAGPEETLVLFDGMRIRDPFHLKDFDGSFSVFDESLIDAVTIHVGTTSADFGDQLGGMVALVPRTPDVAQRTTVGAGLTGLRLTSQGARRQGSATMPVHRSWLASVRRSWLDVVLNAAGATEDAYTAVRPVFDDALLRIAETRVHRSGAMTRLSANLLGTRDGMRFRANGDPALDSDYRSAYAWIAGTHVRGGASTNITLGLTAQRTDRSAFGAGSLRTASLTDDRALEAWSVRATHELAWRTRTRLRFGTDILVERAAATTWRRLGAGVTPETRATGGRQALWMSVRQQWREGLTSDVGVRGERWQHLATDSLRHRGIDPRVALRWALGPHTVLRADLGTSTLGMGVGDRALADADSAWYGAIRGRSWSLGADRMLPGAMQLSLAVYRRYESGGRPRFVNVSGGLTPVGELEPDRQRLDVQGGRAFGVETMVHGAIGARLRWRAAYTSARATDVRPNGAWVPRPWDVRHAATGDLSWEPGRGWLFATAFSWHSGWPYSRAVIHVVAPTRGTAAWPVWMDGRSAAYWRMDARIARSWMIHRTEWRVYADAFNLLNRFNGRGEWTRISRTGTGSATVWRMARYPVQLAPRIPTAGVTVTF